MMNQKFSFGLGFTGITRKEATSIIAEHFGTEALYKGLPNFQYSIPDSEGREWKVITDSDIEPEKNEDGVVRSATGDYKVMVQTPLYSFEYLGAIQEVFAAIGKTKAFTNQSCKAYVEIDTLNHTGLNIKNLINITASKQELIFKAFKFTGLAMLSDELIEEINKNKGISAIEILDKWIKHYGEFNSNLLLDLSKVANEERVSVRFYSNGSLDSEMIKTFIQFCLAINAQALSQKCATARKTETDNERYTFRTWLLRMGLIGDSYKTCRKHLLENLEGNAAFKNPPKDDEEPATTGETLETITE